MGGLFAIGFGVWVLAQVLGGDALGRLGLIPRSGDDTDGGGLSGPPNSGGGLRGGIGG